MIRLPIEIVPVAQTKVDGCCFAVPSKQPQPFTFVPVLLTNHYSISKLLLFYFTSSFSH
jgi:hypothetical protein